MKKFIIACILCVSFTNISFAENFYKQINSDSLEFSKNAWNFRVYSFKTQDTIPESSMNFFDEYIWDKSQHLNSFKIESEFTEIQKYRDVFLLGDKSWLDYLLTTLKILEGWTMNINSRKFFDFWSFWYGSMKHTAFKLDKSKLNYTSEIYLTIFVSEDKTKVIIVKDSYFAGFKNENTKNQEKNNVYSFIHDKLWKLILEGIITTKEWSDILSTYKDYIYKQWMDVGDVQGYANEWMDLKIFMSNNAWFTPSNLYQMIVNTLNEWLSAGNISDFQSTETSKSYYSKIFPDDGLMLGMKDKNAEIYAEFTNSDLYKRIVSGRSNGWTIKDGMYKKIAAELNKLYERWLMNKDDMNVLLKVSYKAIYSENQDPEQHYEDVVNFVKNQIKMYEGDAFRATCKNIWAKNEGWYFPNGDVQSYQKCWSETSVTDTIPSVNNTTSTTNNQYYNRFKSQLWDRLKGFSLTKLQAVVSKIGTLKNKYNNTSKIYLQIEAIRILVEEEVNSRSIHGNDGININSTYPWCNTQDIILLNGQTWAACNVGSSISWTGSVSYGSYYQWGRNDTGFTTINTSPYDWQFPQNNNSWGDTTNTSIARKGPCAADYHVPTQAEWNTADSIAWNNLLPTKLSLPFSGVRNDSDGSITYQGSFGYYWSSSPYSTNSYVLTFGSNAVHPAGNDGRALGFSVRCIKN